MTNAQSKYQDAKSQDCKILSDAVSRIDDFCEENTQFCLKFNNTLGNVMLIDNNYYYLLITQEHKIQRIRGSDGTIRTYIYDENDGIYKTKNNTHILAPHVYMIYNIRMKYGITIDMKQYWEHNEDYFDKNCIDIQKQLHTGNHYRNKRINVPGKVYGR